MVIRLDVAPGCPSLSWVIAQRVTNPHEDADAFISFVGRKGSGKTTASTAFCEELARDIARLRGKGEDPHDFFNATHIRSIDENGAFELLSSGILEKENRVILLDDTGTQWSARKFTDLKNILLGQILQIARIYRSVIIANFIMNRHVDFQARSMTDYCAEMAFKDVRRGISYFKFFFVEQSENGENPYKKYLTWHKKRITLWEIGRPSPELEADVKAMRRANTDTFIQAAREKVKAKMEKMAKKDGPDGRIRDYANHQIVMENKERVRNLLASGKKVSQIVRETGLTRWWVDRCMAVE